MTFHKGPGSAEQASPEKMVTSKAEAVGWQWYASRDEENYTVGPEGSREAVISAATIDFDGEPFFIIEATKGSLRRFLPSADDLLVQISERADDEGAFGDDYCEFTGDTKAAEADLNALLDAWFDRHAAIFPTPWLFDQTRNREQIDPARQSLSPNGAPDNGE